jgi:uncharacterized protein (DUF433 family)
MTSLLNQGMYDATELAYLVGLSVEKVVAWATPDSKGRPGVIGPAQRRTFSFQDLVTLQTVCDLRRRGLSEGDIRCGVATLKDHFALGHPLANQSVRERVGSSGISFVAQLDDDWFDIGTGRQGVFEHVMQLYFATLAFAEDGSANRWNPQPLVAIDPRIQAGAPCVFGTRIPTATIHDLLIDDDAQDIADDFGLTIDQVLSADRFEIELRNGLGIAA